MLTSGSLPKDSLGLCEEAVDYYRWNIACLLGGFNMIKYLWASVWSLNSSSMA